jgi:hypothetical protein
MKEMSITTEVLHIELEKYHLLDRIAKEEHITKGRMNLSIQFSKVHR